MGLKDVVTIKYLKQNRIFADVFNFLLYDGKPVIAPASLEELDSVQKEVAHGKTGKTKLPVERARDVVRELIGMQDSHAAYLILAVEAQSKVHYAMPVRNMLYDALQYARQVEKADDLHKAADDYKDKSDREFLSGFLKEDRLLPIVTVVIYFGAEAWDGPMSIHEMFSIQNQDVLSYVPDYRINLISPASLEEEDLQKFQTSMREVLTFIKYSKDPARLQQALEQDPDFKHLGRDEVNVLNTCVNAKLKFASEESEVLDVCEAIEIMKEEAAARATRAAEEKAAEEMKNVCEAIEIMKEEAAAKATRIAEEKAAEEMKNVCEAIEIMKEEAAAEMKKAASEATRIAEEKAAAEREESERNRIAFLVQSVKNLMKNTGWTAEQAIDGMGLTGRDRRAVMGGLG